MTALHSSARRRSRSTGVEEGYFRTLDLSLLEGRDFMAAAALIFVVAALVTIRPALRAARVDVALLLRRE